MSRINFQQHECWTVLKDDLVAVVTHAQTIHNCSLIFHDEESAWKFAIETKCGLKPVKIKLSIEAA